jgi:cytoskeletal protein CcmA (bactofilin family)
LIIEKTKSLGMEKSLLTNGINLTIIGLNMTVNADIESSDDIKIDGNFRGSINTSGKVIISTTGEVDGDIKASEIEVSGKAEGDFEAVENFIITVGGSFRGSVKTRDITIMESAYFDGKCTISTNNYEPKETMNYNETSLSRQKDPAVREKTILYDTNPQKLQTVNPLRPVTVSNEEPSPDTEEKKAGEDKETQNNLKYYF